MDFKVLGKVLFQVFGTIFVCIMIAALFYLSVMLIGGWTALIIPLFMLGYVIKMMYRDEMVRQGKRPPLYWVKVKV